MGPGERLGDAMLPVVGILSFGFVVSVVLTPRVRRFAHRVGAVDHALSSRKIHGRPIPRMGGLAVLAAFAVALLGAALTWEPARAAILADLRRAVVIATGGLA